MLELIGRQTSGTVPAVPGKTILDHALQNDIAWGFSCERGTCGRCRCLIEEGASRLVGITDAEWERLDDDEMDEGYRLACQAVVKEDGHIRAVYKPYF